MQASIARRYSEIERDESHDCPVIELEKQFLALRERIQRRLPMRSASADLALRLSISFGFVVRLVGSDLRTRSSTRLMRTEADAWPYNWRWNKEQSESA